MTDQLEASIPLSHAIRKGMQVLTRGRELQVWVTPVHQSHHFKRV